MLAKPLTNEPFDQTPTKEVGLVLPGMGVDIVREFIAAKNKPYKTVLNNSVKFDQASYKDLVDAWHCIADSDLWVLLLKLTDAYPERSNHQCKKLLKNWIALRQAQPWQAECLAYWRRWKQHHVDLRDGLRGARCTSWQQLYRFCEIWSVNRPIMAPFCGVAGILLDHIEETNFVADGSDIRINKIVQDKKTAACTDRASSLKTVDQQVIIVTAHATVEEFTSFEASRHLLTAFDNCGLKWSLRQPWNSHTALNTSNTRGVFFWSYKHLEKDFVYHAMAVEERC
ncbi:MAG: hypothetical protein ACI9WC_003812, partial [Arenicella sp.]